MADTARSDVSRKQPDSIPKPTFFHPFIPTPMSDSNDFRDSRIAYYFPHYRGDAIQVEDIFEEVEKELLDQDQLTPSDPPFTKSQIEHLFWVLGNMGLFPDIVEKCRECERYYNTECEGCYLDAEGPDDDREDIGSYCGACVTDDIWRRAYPHDADDSSDLDDPDYDTETDFTLPV
jgi:hypothetical protein